MEKKRLEIHVLTNKYGLHLAMKLPMSLNELLSTMSKIKNALTSMFAEGLLDYFCDKSHFKYGTDSFLIILLLKGACSLTISLMRVLVNHAMSSASSNTSAT